MDVSLLRYAQNILYAYKLVRRGIIPDEAIVLNLYNNLPPDLQSQIDDDLGSKVNAFDADLAGVYGLACVDGSSALTVDDLVGVLSRGGESALNKLAVLNPGSGRDVKVAGRIAKLRAVQASLSRKLLRSSLRTPEQIFEHISSNSLRTNGVSLPLLVNTFSPIEGDDQQLGVKLETLCGGPSHPRDVTGRLLAMVSILRLHGRGPLGLHLGTANRIRGELQALSKQFMDGRRARRENAKMIVRSIALKVEAIEARKVQRAEREERERMKALRDKDMDSYMKLIKQSKNQRIHEILENTEKMLQDIGARIELEKASAAKDAAAPVDNSAGPERVQIPSDEEARKQYYRLSHRLHESVKQPSMIVGGDLMGYQLAGLEFLLSLYNNNLSGILADEMGLGKTVQTISLLAYLCEYKRVQGPHLIVVPLSTLSNWVTEFKRWCPDLKVLEYRGTRVDRISMNKKIRRLVTQYNVVVTTYEYILREKRAIGSVRWIYIVVDEGHKMKNIKSKFHRVLSNDYRSQSRLLLTGTPLQNNLNELWSLLNFIMPQTFSNIDDFDRWFEEPFGNKSLLSEEERLIIINRLHLILRPFILRRIKADVLLDLPDKREYIIRILLSPYQSLIYDRIINRKGNLRLANVLMQLRKVANHPYLFLNSYPIDNHIVSMAGKFEVLDRILPKLLLFNHKILIFCQLTQLMDVLQDYLNLRHFKHYRLDGSTGNRQPLIDQFNDAASDTHVFILSTRAGGLGLNLQSADTVIIFDSDWNPHQDLQAQARAHRLGQSNEVRVYRFVTNSPVENLIISRAQDKLDIDQKIIQAGMFNSKFNEQTRISKLKELLHSQTKNSAQRITTPQELNLFLARTEEELNTYTQLDQETFTPKTYQLFCDEEVEEDSQKLKQSSGEPDAEDEDEDAGETNTTTISPSPISPIETSNEFVPTTPITTTAVSTASKESARILGLLIQSNRLVAIDDIPEELQIPSIHLEPDVEQKFFDIDVTTLGPRRSRLRSQRVVAPDDEEVDDDVKADDVELDDVELDDGELDDVEVDKKSSKRVIRSKRIANLEDITPTQRSLAPEKGSDEPRRISTRRTPITPMSEVAATASRRSRRRI